MKHTQKMEESVKRVKREEIVFFWKPSDSHGFLSNWSPHKIVENGIEFSTMEHYMMYHKAVLMGDKDTARRILKAKTPTEAKGLGRIVRGFSEEKWVERRETVVFNGLLLKIRQHPGVKRQLLETGESLLAEASPYDRIWGIGMKGDHPRAQNPDMWQGANLLGKAWMRVREG